MARAGLESPFPIQAATIADALTGADVLGKARTGSGKTLAFGLPMLARLAEGPTPQPRKPHGLVLVPTRELAMQVNDALEPYAHALHVSLRLVAGGLSMSKQITAVERGVHLIVATPGRLADLQRRGHVDLSACRIVALDEADHMAQMGFMEEITHLLKQTPSDGQRLLFSATLDGDVDTLVRTYMHAPRVHDVSTGAVESHDITHVVLQVPGHLKYQIATRVAARDGRTIAFVRTKLGCERIAEDMRQSGVNARALHGDLNQAQRNAAIKDLRAGRVPVVVATDVAARGIHIDAVDLVLHVDPPADHKDYTHRAGRTGRAGATGTVVTLVLPHQRRGITQMLERAGVTAQVHRIDDQSWDTVDSLTGGQEPSGVPVALAPTRPRRDVRPARGGQPRHHSAPSWYQSGTAVATGSHESALAEREARLAARERDLARRERELISRESAGRAAPSSAASTPQQARASAGRPPAERKPRHRSQSAGQQRPGPSDKPARADRKAPSGERSEQRRDAHRAPTKDSKKDTKKQSSRRGKPRPKKKR